MEFFVHLLSSLSKALALPDQFVAGCAPLVALLIAAPVLYLVYHFTLGDWPAIALAVLAGIGLIFGILVLRRLSQ